MTRTRSTILPAAILAWAVAGSALAASPVPSEAPGERAFGNIEVWLDQPIPPDIAAGESIVVGFTLWDNQAAGLSTMDGLYLRLHPATGKARPTEAETRSDWPGHILANVIVPKGGPGAIETGISGRACTSDGKCTDVDFPFAVGGVGPPPEAPHSILVEARLRPLVQPVIAGRPVEVAMSLVPRAAWDPATIGLPDRLIVFARSGTGPDLASTEIHRDAGPVDLYRGQITIPDPGDVALMFAIPGNGAEDDVIQSATTRLKVVEPDDSSPPAAVADPGQGDVPWPLIGGGAALVLLASLVIRRVFADL
jgi:hypothetical protein